MTASSTDYVVIHATSQSPPLTLLSTKIQYVVVVVVVVVAAVFFFFFFFTAIVGGLVDVSAVMIDAGPMY